MTFSIKIKTNKSKERDYTIFGSYLTTKEIENAICFPYSDRPKYFIKKIQEGENYNIAVIGYKVLPRSFSIGFWGRCRIQINIWPLFTILIKI